MSESIQSKGGNARAKSLTKEQRSEIARKSAQTRWDIEKNIPKASHGSNDRPLVIGEIELPCYVLEDGRRVLTAAGVQGGVGIAQGGSMVKGVSRLELFIDGKLIKPFVSSELADRVQSPVLFKTLKGQRAYGYEAEVLAEICETVLKARSAGALQKQQMNIANQCEVLVRGFARVGLVALVDEVTGYQYDRAKDALSDILERFIAKELQSWVKTFPDEYYENLFRLRGLAFPKDTVKRPQYFGRLTNDIIYSRLAPSILSELKKTTPKQPKGVHLHRKLTPEYGHPKLREHMASVVTIMKLSDNYDDFLIKLNKLHPRYDDTLILDFDKASEEGL